ncbi:hypothetical protein D9M72_487360 [compost metagenome]
MARRVADGAIGALGDQHQLRSALQPFGGKVVVAAFHAEPGKIFVGELDDIRHRRHAVHAGEMCLAVPDEAGPDVRIEGDDPLLVLARHQGFIGRAAGLGDQADRTEMQRLAEIAKRRQVL